jgi:hypothetical protein
MGSKDVKELPPKCSKCMGDINGKPIIVNGKVYHETCAPGQSEPSGSS